MRLLLPQYAVKERPASHIAEVIETSTTEFLAHVGFVPMKVGRKTSTHGSGMVLGDRTYQHLPPCPPQIHPYGLVRCRRMTPS